MAADDAIGLSIPVMFILFWVSESVLGGGRRFPEIPYWTLLGVLGFLVSGAMNVLLPLVLVPLLAPVHVVTISGWGLWAAPAVLILTTFLTYWSHRLQHKFDMLWRLGHQLHHAAARVDMGSAMMFHPIDLVFQVGMTVLAASLLGATEQAAALAGALNFAIACYQHWNVPTPQWTGYLIQRPEAHVLHHERNVHSRNFGDLPLWDMLFGTFANPATVDRPVGFEPDRGRRLMAMILCQDVNQTMGREKQ